MFATIDRNFDETGELLKYPCIIKPLPHHIRGLSYTASGYGRKIPTQYMMLLKNRWRRIYCCIFSNSGTLYLDTVNKQIDNITIVTIEDYNNV